MASNSSYTYPDPVAAVLRAANARRPRVKQTVITSGELAQILSDEVQRDEWVAIGGEAARIDGTTPEGHLDDLIAARTDAKGECHWIEAEEVSKVNDEVWCTGGARGLTLQGERYRTIRSAFAPGKEWDKHAAHLLDEEAKIYGTKVGSVTPGKPPGEPEKPEGAAPKLPGQGANSNPWHPSYFGSPEQKLAAQVAILKSKGGPALGASLARSCSVDLAGRPLAAGKSYK